MEDWCDNYVLAANSANLLFQLNRKIPIQPNAQWHAKSRTETGKNENGDQRSASRN